MYWHCNMVMWLRLKLTVLHSEISQTATEFNATIAFWCNFDEIPLFWSSRVLKAICQTYHKVWKVFKCHIIPMKVLSHNVDGLDLMIGLYLRFCLIFLLYSCSSNTILTLCSSSCIKEFNFQLVFPLRSKCYGVLESRKLICKYSRFRFPDSPICYTERAQSEARSYF